MNRDANVSELFGQVLTQIEQIDNEELIFHTEGGKVYTMYHQQDCCESVRIEEIIGDLLDLVGSPILQAEESSEDGANDWGTSTWTFYKFATVKGYVTIRWVGESNGYYSERVDFIEGRSGYTYG